MTHRSAIQVENLRVSYFTDIAVQDVSFTVPTGTMTAIVGPNGAGKSTLLKALLRLVPIDTGEVLLLGQNVKRARRRVAYVPQRGEVDWTFPITVADTVLLGTYPRLGLFRRPGRAERRLAHEMLEKVGWPARQHTGRPVVGRPATTRLPRPCPGPAGRGRPVDGPSSVWTAPVNGSSWTSCRGCATAGPPSWGCITTSVPYPPTSNVFCC